MTQNVLATNLVVEHVEAEGRLRLRLAIELPLKAPDLLRCCEAHRQSPSPHQLRKRTRSRGPLLHRHYPASSLLLPRPTPAVAAALRDVEAATLARNGSPPITTNHLSDVPCLLPRRIERVRVSIASLLMQPSPNGRRVGIRIVTIEACSGFTRVTARRDRSAAQGGLCREAPTRPVTRPSRSPASGPIDNYPGGTFLH